MAVTEFRQPIFFCRYSYMAFYAHSRMYLMHAFSHDSVLRLLLTCSLVVVSPAALPLSCFHLPSLLQFTQQLKSSFTTMHQPLGAVINCAPSASLFGHMCACTPKNRRKKERINEQKNNCNSFIGVSDEVSCMIFFETVLHATFYFILSKLLKTVWNIHLKPFVWLVFVQVCALTIFFLSFLHACTLSSGNIYLTLNQLQDAQTTITVEIVHFYRLNWHINKTGKRCGTWADCQSITGKQPKTVCLVDSVCGLHSHTHIHAANS